MSYEERMERIEARHEALAQAVEILAGVQKKTEQFVQVLFESQAKVNDAQEVADCKMAQMMDAIGRLANIAVSRDERLDRLEGQ